MSKSTFVSVYDAVHRAPASLAQLVATANRLDEASKLLRSFLDAPLNRHVVVAGLGGERVTLLTDSPSWATRLRYESPQIVAYLSRMLEAPDLRGTRVMVRVPDTLPLPLLNPTRRARLSPASGSMLRDVANTLSDSALAAALRRLAENAVP